MSDNFAELLETTRKIHDLLELLAAEKIAERDAKQRAVLREIIGTRPTMQKSIYLMNGTRTQKQIRTETGAHQGDFSTMVGKLHKAKLLVGDTIVPKLIISVPPTFFENNAKAK